MNNKQNENISLSNTQKIITSLFAGGCAGAVAKTTIAPLDRAKINFQVRTDKFSYSLCFKFIRDTYRNEGFLSLYRGNSANLVRVIPSAAIYFTAHEQWKRLLNTDKYERTPGRRFIAGSLAGVTSATLTYPLDLARARMAVTNKTVYTNLSAVFLTILRNEGVIAFYRGAICSMVGVLPYSGCVFFTYESLKHIRLDYHSHRPMTKTERMLFGAISGLIGQTVSYPFDVVRRRLQTAVVIRPNDKSLGAIATARKIIFEEGITTGLYKGVTMNWMKGPISVGVSFMTFDILIELIRQSTFFTQNF
jgi:solute carrier family 25 protein 42